MALQSRRSEVLKLYMEEREVGISQAKCLKKKKRVGVKRIKGWVWALWWTKMQYSSFGLYGGHN